MPSGATHNGITVAATVLVSGGLLFTGVPPDQVGAVAAGQLTGLLCSPDLDLDVGNRSDTLIRAIFPPLEWAWDLLWWPYRKLFAHRGISHTPFIGTGTRVLYTLPINPIGWSIFWPLSPYNWLWFVGLCISDILHYIADNLVSSHRRQVRGHVDYKEFKRWTKARNWNKQSLADTLILYILKRIS